MFEKSLTIVKKACAENMKKTRKAKKKRFVSLQPLKQTHRFCRKQKNKLRICSEALFCVRPQGLEPWTNRLRVYCSTN